MLARLGAARAFADRAQPGDADAALALLDVVAAQAAELGLGQAQVQASSLIARLRHSGLASGPQALGVFRFDGEVWTLSFGGQTALLPDAKGLHDLHQLLANPGTEIAAVRLLDSSGGVLAAAAGALGADAVLDERAKAEYRARIASLNTQLDAAVARGDDDKASRLEAERDTLIEELGRAFGLRGRPRLLGDEAERARKTVTARIRDVLRRLDSRHPLLAEYLRRTVSTGTYCGYQPDHPVSWNLGRAGPFP